MIRPKIVQKMVTIEVRKVMVDTWHPRPLVRSSKRSGPMAQMNLYLIGDKRGKARDKGSIGRGRHVLD